MTKRKMMIALLVSIMVFTLPACDLGVGGIGRVGDESEPEPVSDPYASLSPEVGKVLSTIESDYSKIRWGVIYPLSEQYPGVVVSISPYDTDPYHYLAVAVTNVHSVEVTFTGSMEAKSDDSSVIGMGSFYEEHLGPGQTIISLLYCGTDKLPDGRIHWSDVQIKKAEDDRYIPWEADWSLSKSPGYRSAKAELAVTGDGGDPHLKKVDGLLIDDKGFILSGAEAYVYDIKPQEGRISTELEFYATEHALERISDMAVFANCR